MKFSITIPAYKAKFLKEAIDSCLGQSFGDFELIIVDDCSPNNIKAITDNYNDPRIHYYRNEKNCGAENVVDNWNKCLDLCSGDYVICMGDDDRLVPTTLEQYNNLIKKYPGIGLLHGWTEIINEDSQFVELTAPRVEYESAYSLLWNRWDNRKLQFIGDWCFEIEWLRKQGGFYKIPLAWESDDITSIIGALKNGVANTSEIAFQYRRSRYTISANNDVQLKMEAKKKASDWYENFLKEPPQNSLDCKYWEMLVKMFSAYRRKAYALTFATDIKGNPLTILKWIKKRGLYGYSFKEVLFAVYMAVKG